MFTYVLIAFIAIVLYQILITVFYAITKSEEKALTLSIIIPYGFYRGICNGIIGPIYLNWCKKNLKKYRCCFKDANGDIGTSIQAWYATDKTVSKFTQDESKDYFIRQISDCSDIKDIPEKGEVYRGQAVFKGFDMKLFET